MLSAPIMSIFLYVSVAAAVQLTASSLSRIPTLRQPHDAAYSVTRERLQSRNLLLIAASDTLHLAPPSLYATLVFFLALLFGYLFTCGLHVNAHPLHHQRHIHTQRAMLHERPSVTIKSAEPSQERSIPPSTTNLGHFAAPTRRPAEPGLHDGVTAELDGSSVLMLQQSILSCGHQRRGELPRQSARNLLGKRVQNSIEAFQPHPKDNIPPSTLELNPMPKTSVASQSPRKLNSLLFLAITTLLFVLSGLLGMANAADPGSVLGDSTNTVIPVATSTSSSLATATAISTSLSLSSASETQATATIAATSTNTTTITAPSRTVISAAVIAASISTSAHPHTSMTTSSSPPSTSLVLIGHSSYTTVIAATITGLMSVKAGMGSTTTERYFVFSYTTVNTTVTTSNCTMSTSAINATTSLALATSASASSSISSTTFAVGNLSSSTSSAITTMPSAITNDLNISSPALSSLPTTNINTPFAVSYVPGRATISSFVPAPAADSSNTYFSISRNATLDPLSQNTTPLLPNGTTSSVSGTIYRTVTSTRSVVFMSTVISNALASQLASETQSIFPATSPPPNTVATIINGTISTDLPTSRQVTASAALISQSSSPASISSATNVEITPPVIMSETTTSGTTWTTLLTMQTVTYSSVVSSKTVGGSDLASAATVQTSSVTSRTGLAGYFTSTSMATPSPMSAVSVSTSIVLIASQPQVSPQYLVPNASFSRLPEPQDSPPLGLHREETESAVPITSAFFHTTSASTSTPVPTQPLPSASTSAPAQAATVLPTDTITPTNYEKRELSHPISVVYVTVKSTITPVVISNVHPTMYNPEYAYETCSQDQYMFRSCHSEKPSTDPLFMGHNCIYPVSSTKMPPQMDFHHDMSLPNEVRDGHTVLTVTVTSFVDETYSSLVSPEDISNHLTALSTSGEALPTSLFGFGFDGISIDARNIHWTTGVGFTPTLSLEPRPTAAPSWFTIDTETIPPPPGFKTYHPTSKAMPTAGQDLDWSPNRFAEPQEPYWALVPPDSDTTTMALDPTASILTADFAPSTDQPTAAASRVLLDYESSHVSAEVASWEANQVPTSPPLAPRDDTVSHGTGFATLSRQSAGKAVTCVSPLTPVAGVTLYQARAERTGVCLNGWNMISSGGEKRIKAWYQDGAVNSYVVAALVIGLGVIGGAVVRAMEDVRQVVGGVGMGFW